MTAICPRCKMDAIIPLENNQKIDYLKEINETYFACYDKYGDEDMY